jgi:hypothetical protein
MSKRLAAVTAAALLLALAPSAYAAKAFTIGTGTAPDVAVESSGTAHVAFVEASPEGSRAIHYCKVPRNATACSISTSLAAPMDTIGQNSVHVFTPSAGRVLIAADRCCGDADGVYVFQSTDDGATFSAPVQIGTIDGDGGETFANEAIYGVTVGGNAFQRMPLAGPVPGSAATLDAGFPVPITGGVGLIGGTTPVKVSADGNHASFHVQNGAGDPNDASTWAGPTAFSPGSNDLRVASGSAGVVLLSSVPNGTPPSLYTQKWNGTAFGAPAAIAPSVMPAFYALNTDPSGRFTALWTEQSAQPNEVRFAQSSDGTTWSKPTTILRESVVGTLFSTKVSTAADGHGFGVWDANSPTGPITVAPLEPLADLTGNAGTPNTVATTTVGGVQVGLIAPTSCVNPGDKVTLRVTSKVKKKLSPTQRVKITLAVFSLDKTKVSDKKAAFKGIFATTGFKAPSKHPLSAVVTLKPVKGNAKPKKKTLKGTLTICG